MKLNTTQEKKKSYSRHICYTKKIKKTNDRNIVRKNCFENTSLSHMDIVEGFFFKKQKREVLYYENKHISYVK